MSTRKLVPNNGGNMQRRTFLHAGLLAGTALTLAGCGFRLRGFDTPGLAIAELALAGSNSEFSQLTEERLTRAGTQVNDRAALILNLGPENFREHRLSVLESGPQEHEMRLTVPYSVQRRSDNAYLIAEQRLEVSTRFTLSDANLLAHDELREEARRELREEALRRLLERLRTLSPQS